MTNLDLETRLLNITTAWIQVKVQLKSFDLKEDFIFRNSISFFEIILLQKLKEAFDSPIISLILAQPRLGIVIEFR